jgi:hypothetical protein
MRESVNIKGYTYDRLAYELPFEGQDVVHEICSVREDGSDICTCGLVLAEGDNSLQDLGCTQGDFLAAALERTGWTVEVGDPRAERFLDRTIELTREQDEGRINLEQVYETLRREFPLM